MLKNVCNINYVRSTQLVNVEQKIPNWPIASVESPSTNIQQTKQTGKDSRHVMVCQWHISNNCVQMYDIIRLYVGWQKQVVLFVKKGWFSYRRDLLTLAIFPMGQKLAGIISSLGDCELCLYFLIFRVVQYQVLTHPPPTSRQNKLAKRRHVMVCQWHISKNCVQMYDIIRLYVGGQKQVVLSE